MKGKFWCVWRKNGNIPVAQHPEQQYAAGEASRLSRLHPGEIFYILEAVGLRYQISGDKPMFEVKKPIKKESKKKLASNTKTK